MKQANLAFVAAGLLAASLALTGCNQFNRKDTMSGSSLEAPATQNVRRTAPGSTTAAADLREKTASRLQDAKLYCLGIILYAQKHNNMCPTNLNQTLPYLRAANSLPSGTNHFEILYHGSFNELPVPVTNGIVVLRSDAWQMADGEWTRIYGFADGHCEAHSEPKDNFAAWEKQHSLNP